MFNVHVQNRDFWRETEIVFKIKIEIFIREIELNCDWPQNTNGFMCML